MKHPFTFLSHAWRPALVAGLLCVAAATPRQAMAQRVLWADDAQVPVVARTTTAQLAQYRPVAFQLDALRQALSTAPAAGPNAARTSATVISLPLPDGSSARFRVAQSVVMDPALAARYPLIKTYEAQGIDNPDASARLDVTPAGVHAMIRTLNEVSFIDPAAKGDAVHHLVFDRRAMNEAQRRACYTDESMATVIAPTLNRAPNGTTLRTYRLAVAATGEYTLNKSVNPAAPTKAEALSAIVTSINRVTGIYEQELAIRFVIIPNNDAIIYLDPATDPYTNLSNSATLNTNQTTLDNIIGTANYDIGHIFNTADGGIAGLGVVCRAGNKARGSTGLPNPTGDAFDVDYVAHEIGHQFGGAHTFNGNTGSCGGSNRSASSAYEPGSGTTIMAYAGICGAANNTQANSDPYFHVRSFDQITTFVTTGLGTCSVNTPTGNQPPVVNAGPSYSIPLNTPFTLTGSATDADGDRLTYSWEQFDLGATGAPTAPVGDAPIFRTFPPTTSPARTFPAPLRPGGTPGALLTNVPVIGEILPTYARTMNFRLVARDNRPGGGGVDYAATTVAAVANTGPFVLTVPNTADVVWTSGVPQQVIWDVANTTAAPINATRVNILLSTDGGRSFPITLLSSTPNDGFENVTVPPIYGNIPTARIKVEAAGNIFFDISNFDFAIQTSTTPTFFLAPGTLPVICPGQSGNVAVNVGQFQNFRGTVALTVSNLPTGVTATLTPTSLLAGNNAQLILSTAATVAPGTYQLTLTGTSGMTTQTKVINFTVSPTACPTATRSDAAAKGVSVYPNPSTGSFLVHVENAQRGSVQLQVTDAVGRTVVREALTKTGATLDHALNLNALKAGIYQLHLHLPDGTTVTRLVKE